MELRIKNIKILPGNWLTKIWQEISEGGEYEVKFLFACSDGIKDGNTHLSLDVIPINIQGSHDFGPHGFTLYRSPPNIIPDFLDVHLTLLEDDSGIRTISTLMDQAVQTDQYKSLMERIAETVASPWAPAIHIADDLFSIAVNVMKGNSDDLWMQEDCSFTKEYGEFTDEPIRLTNDRLSVELIMKGGEV